MRYFKLFQLLSTLFLVLGSVQAQPILFGLTTKGGANGAGTLIKIDGSKAFGSALTVIKHFDASTGSSGRMAYGGMIKAGDLFYGMTSKGGANDAGTIFSFNPATEVFIKLYDFGASGTNGKEPFANLMLASNGKLYGTTQFGGSSNKGTIFSFDTTSKTCSFIYSFSGGDNDGARPICSLVQIPDGRIFGLTKDGGNLVDASNGFGSGIERCGTIFSIDPADNAYKVEHKFISATFDNDYNIINDIGFNPHGSLAYHKEKGKLYGTTLEGFGGTGSVFSFDPAIGSAAPFETVKGLDQSVSRPYSTPLIGDNGKLYFTTLNSTNEAGTISQLDLDNGNALTVLRDFTYYQDTLGTVPNRELFQASDRKLYGIVTERWPNQQLKGYGSVYQLGVDDKSFVKLANLDTLLTGNGSAWLSNGANSFVEYINNTPTPKDSDADGVPDTLDIDDDNDGITDDAENGEADLLLLNPGFELTNPLVTTGAGAISNSNMVGWKTSAQDSTFEVWQSGFLTVPAYEGNQFIEINGNYAATVYQDFASTPGAIIRWTFAHRGRSGTDVVKMKVGASGGTLSDVTTASDGNSAWGVYTGVYTVPAGQTITRIAFESVSSSNGNPTYGNFLDGIKFEVEPAFRDTDGDGIVNRLDPDSDGDGCSDAKEGGATTSTTSDYVFTSAVGSNGLADELETTVDNGEVKYTLTYVAFATDATKNACKTKPTFTIVASACSNNAPSLPLTSDNGVSGTWNPAQVNKASTNTTKYVFIPSDLTTADTASATIAITLYQKPAFTSISSVCLGATAPTLPANSNNGIIGTWTPSTINTAIANTTKYVFVPSPGGPCIDTASMTIAVAQCCVANVKDTKTLSQGGWATTSTTNPLTESWFNSKFQGLLVIGDATNRINITSAAAVRAFLPNSGTPAALNKTWINPTNKQLKNTFAGQLVALALNLALNPGLGYAKITSGIYANKTVKWLYDESNIKISTTLTKSTELTNLSDACNKVNLSFDGTSTGFVACSYVIPSAKYPGVDISENKYFTEKISSTEKSNINAFPNPTNKHFTIKNTSKSAIGIRILNISGMPLETFNKLQPSETRQFGSNYIAGIYLLEIIENEKVTVKKIVKLN